MMELSIIFPAYNEAERIVPTLRSFHEYLSRKGYAFELLVVDDGSTDQTIAVVEQLKTDLSHLRIIASASNRGKGHAVRIGMLDAQGAIRLFSDADGSTPVTEIEKLILPLKSHQYEMAIGSRYLLESKVNRKQPVVRRVWSRGVNKLVQQILLPGIVDPHCGFKAFTAEATQQIFSQCEIDGWSFDLEVMAFAGALDLRVLEVPVIWNNDDRSKGRLHHLPKEIASLYQIKKRIHKQHIHS